MLHLTRLQYLPCHWTKRRKRKYGSTWPWRKILLKDSTPFSTLIYWHNFLISQLVSPYMSYSISLRKLERHLGMRLLIQSLFWRKCHQSLLMITGLSVPNAIWHHNRCHASLSLLRTCSLRIIRMIDPCITQDISAMLALKGFKSTQGLL